MAVIQYRSFNVQKKFAPVENHWVKRIRNLVAYCALILRNIQPKIVVIVVFIYAVKRVISHFDCGHFYFESFPSIMKILAGARGVSKNLKIAPKKCVIFFGGGTLWCTSFNLYF